MELIDKKEKKKKFNLSKITMRIRYMYIHFMPSFYTQCQSNSLPLNFYHSSMFRHSICKDGKPDKNQ